MAAATEQARDSSISSQKILIRIPWATEKQLKMVQATEGVSSAMLSEGYGITVVISPGFQPEAVRAELVLRLQLEDT